MFVFLTAGRPGRLASPLPGYTFCLDPSEYRVTDLRTLTVGMFYEIWIGTESLYKTCGEALSGGNIPWPKKPSIQS